MIRTPLTDLLGISHPIAATGMGYVSGARLTAAEGEPPGNILSYQVGEILGAVEQEEHRLLQSRYG